MSRIILIIVLLKLICVWCANASLCNLQHGKKGKCKPFNECPIVMEDLYERRLMPTFCAYHNDVYTVCCPVIKRVEKCEVYAEYVYETIIYPPFGPRQTPLVQKKNRCGQNGAPFISGGELASPREYPHSALLGYRPHDKILWRCGGSLVSSRYVLTAGHCLHHNALGSVLKVRLGDLNYTSNTDDAKPMDYDIEIRISHPDYKRSSRYNDIALLKLSSQVKLSPYVRPICLPTADIEPNEYIATGWGFTADYGNASDSLLKVKLQSFEFDDCQNTYRNYISRKFRYGLKPSQLCAGHRTERKDACNGDSGGPLQAHHPDAICSFTQYGIISFGISCEQINFPAVYTRVFYYIDWIESIIWAPGEDI